MAGLQFAILGFDGWLSRDLRDLAKVFFCLSARHWIIRGCSQEATIEWNRLGQTPLLVMDSGDAEQQQRIRGNFVRKFVQSQSFFRISEIGRVLGSLVQRQACRIG